MLLVPFCGAQLGRSCATLRVGSPLIDPLHPGMGSGAIVWARRRLYRSRFEEHAAWYRRTRQSSRNRFAAHCNLVSWVLSC